MSRTTLVLITLLAGQALVSGHAAVADTPKAEVRAADAAGGVSELWGRDGERWDAGGRLGDFSFAGYGRGERAIPDVPVVADVVRDFGAKGDGEHDDTAAFRRAIAEAKPGAIHIPPGRYVITDVLDVRRGGLVLRGAGTGKTTLYFPKPLHAVRPNPGDTSTGRPTSNYSWSGGFIWVRGEFPAPDKPLATVTEPAKRGGRELVLSSTRGLSVGQSIDLQQRDEPSNSLVAHLYAGQAGDTKNLRGRTGVSLTCRVMTIDGNRMTIDRALRWDVHPARWKPRVLPFEPTVTEVGIESLRFEFPVTPYEGHFTELGYNAISLQGVADCWVRDVVIDHADSGLFVSGRFCTLERVVFNSARKPDKGRQSTGHHGVTLSGNDNLFTGFRFNTPFIHDITLGAAAAGNVVSAGVGVDLSFDHHRRAPHANLFTDIDAGAGTRLWRSGGGAGLGKHAGAWTTFWNVRTEQPQAWPPAEYGPDLMNLVGVTSVSPAIREPGGKWFEPAAAADQPVSPPNLHEAHLRRRLAGKRE